jgi:hypothetical protein
MLKELGLVVSKSSYERSQVGVEPAQSVRPVTSLLPG